MKNNDFWATQTLAKILWAGILLWRPGVAKPYTPKPLTPNSVNVDGVIGHLAKPYTPKPLTPNSVNVDGVIGYLAKPYTPTVSFQNFMFVFAA